MEFALVAPLLVLLLLGIIEFGWKFGQFNDVRHGAREGARYAAVNGGTVAGISDAAAIRTHVCEAMDAVTAGVTELRVGLNLDPDVNGTASERGDLVSIRVEADVDALTGAPLITIFLPDTLTSDIDFRMEREPSGWVGSDVSLQSVSC